MERPDAPLSLSAPLDPASVIEWNEAYETVESYFCALGLRNKLLLSNCIHRVLRRVVENHDPASGQKPATLAMIEAMRLVADWLQSVLQIELPDSRLAARGRLGLMLADLNGQWQPWFLVDEPWPEEFVKTMREGYLSAGPAFQERNMTPQSIELSPLLHGFSDVLESLGNIPFLKISLVVVIGIALALALLLGM
jgi:hypothetical protein